MIQAVLTIDDIASRNTPAIVDYLREAYLHPAEEVRITFDMQLRTGLNSIDLFNPYIPTVPPFLGSCSAS